MTHPKELLGQTIVNARAARRMTQKDLERALGVTRQSLSRWEQGYEPSPANLSKLREVLGPDVWRAPTREPMRIGFGDVRGARYAAVMMTETVAAILRECARVEDLAESQADRDLAEKAIATHRAAPPATSKASATPARRPRRA